MLQVENEYETPIESKYYQNNENFGNCKKADNTQNVTDYTEQEPKGSSSTNKIYHNTANKIQPPRKNIGKSHFS